MAPMVVTSEAGLRDWARRRPRAPLLLDMAALTKLENDVWAKTINRLRSECGCSAGAATLVTVAVAYPALIVFGHHHMSGRLALELVAGLLCSIAAAAFAKAIAVLLARQRMHGAISTVAALAAARHLAGQTCVGDHGLGGHPKVRPLTNIAKPTGSSSVRTSTAGFLDPSP